ncbi:hypothetical protein [Mycobacteroides franklinii]|uniref:hypothetical protein n=1 Tax=Mycobacteroides franklinii TaxID=948102 RepID=UPI0012FF982B|nr:hypothetical protein [Mycobacteroides franklinii]
MPIELSALELSGFLFQLAANLFIGFSELRGAEPDVLGVLTAYCLAIGPLVLIVGCGSRIGDG